MLEKHNTHLYCPECETGLMCTVLSVYNDDDPRQPVSKYIEIGCPECDYYEFSNITND